MMSPTVDQVATDYTYGRQTGRRLEPSRRRCVTELGASPPVLLFKGGKIVDQKVGAIGKPEFQKMLDAHVSSK